METMIAQARANVERTFLEAKSLVESQTRSPYFEVETKLWTMLLELGQALTSVFLVRQTDRPRSTSYRHAGRRFLLGESRTTPLGTRFGKVSFTRPIGRPVGHPREAADLPVDRELGLCGGFSLGVVNVMTRLCTQMAFASARETFGRTQEWTPSPRATLRMVDAAGAQARGFLEQSPPPADDGDVLVLQVDGKGAPMISTTEHERRQTPHRFPHVPGRASRRLRKRSYPRKRRTSGKKSKNAKISFVGVIYGLKFTDRGVEGPIGKRLMATFESHEEVFKWLRREADKRGYGRKRTVFLADGADAIWRLQEQYFPEAEVCLDWYHVVEKLWGAGACLHREGSQKLATWVGKQTARLRTGDLGGLFKGLANEFGAIAKTGPGNKGRRDRLLKVIDHLVKNQHRLNYAALRKDDLDIGTGAAEGAVRHLVGMRFDGSGMRWSRQRSERLLHLRCILLNGQWDEFVDYLALRSPLKMLSQPVPTQTHDAVAAA